jgi:Putative metallopeptidase
MHKSVLASLACLCLVACSGGGSDAAAREGTAQFPALGANIDAFVEGNLIFNLYHEMGHAVISEYGLPVAGREEDAADRFAIWQMTPEVGKGAPDHLVGAMHGWFLISAEKPLATMDWWDIHSTEQQRAYQIACLLYGTDKERFGKAVAAARLPEGSDIICKVDARKNTTAWSKLLAPHVRPKDSIAPESSITIRYDDPEDHANDIAYLKKIRLLENLSILIRSRYNLKPGITLQGLSCGEPNATWDSYKRTVRFCYEMVRRFKGVAERSNGALALKSTG